MFSSRSEPISKLIFETDEKAVEAQTEEIG